jgi:meiotically up-regulated gene 157 (Mug157) protein
MIHFCRTVVVMTIVGMSLGPLRAAETFTSKRPPLARRTFKSDAVEKVITQVNAAIKDPKLAWVFDNCYPNTLDTTVDFEMKNGQPDTFIITGDIDAMWQRDSSAEVQPYLPLCRKDAHLAQMVAGLIRRQSRNMELDPYANAFFKDESKISPHKSQDHTLMKPGVFERKWELDSLCYCIRLDYQYWKITGDASVFDADWRAAMKTAVDTMVDQQRKNGKGSYRFVRGGNPGPQDGYGAPVNPVGMICSMFRNSDDAATYLFNIPENLFAVTSLRQMAGMLDGLHDSSGLAARARTLADEVEAAVQKYGLIDDGHGGKMYAYECDGFGKFLRMDDAGIPGLVSIPYLGYKTNQDPIYRSSRSFALSPANPFFYQGAFAEGTGSPHIGGPMIWTLGISDRGLTSDNDQERLYCLRLLVDSQAGTGFMHESFDKDNAKKFTRPWFAWANSLFAEFVLQLDHDKPALLQQDMSRASVAP